MADKPDILAHGTLPPHAIDGLRQHFTLHQIAGAAELDGLDPALRKTIRGMATRSMVGATSQLMDQLPGLQIISIFGVGTDAVDRKAAAARSILVTNTPDVLTEDTADYAIGLVFALARRIVEGDRFVRAGRWLQGGLQDSTRIRGRTLGIAGMGRIGTAVAQRATALGMRVVWHGPSPKPDVPFPYCPTIVELASEADFLVLTLPGGAGTESLVDAQVLQALGPEGYLINISRGTVVDEDALVAALSSRGIAGAALDVFRREPHVPAALTAFDNVIVEPHIASTTRETRRDIGNLMIANLLAHFSGDRPPNQVYPD